MTEPAMKLTVIGCSGSFPGPESAASCYLVEAEDPQVEGRIWRVLLDLGSGALGPLQRYVDPLSIDAVLISHLHADHFFDISGYYVLRKYHPSGSVPAIPIYGPKGLKRRVARAYGLPRDPGMTEEFRFERLGRGPLRLGPLSITTARVDHPVEAFAIRVQCGDRALVYSGDTGPSQRLTELSRGAELLLAEAAFRDGEDNPPHLHLTGSDAARTAAEAGVGRLVLTHIPPWHERVDAEREARPHFAGEISMAEQGGTYLV